MDDITDGRASAPSTDPVAPWVPATLDGLPGEAHPPPAGTGGVGTWQGDLDAPMLAALLRAAAAGTRLVYRDAHSERRVLVQRCWYDPVAARVRVGFAAVAAPA